MYLLMQWEVCGLTTIPLVSENYSLKHLASFTVCRSDQLDHLHTFAATAIKALPYLFIMQTAGNLHIQAPSFPWDFVHYSGQLQDLWLKLKYLKADSSTFPQNDPSFQTSFSECVEYLKHSEIFFLILKRRKVMYDRLLSACLLFICP